VKRLSKSLQSQTTQFYGIKKVDTDIWYLFAFVERKCIYYSITCIIWTPTNSSK